MYAPLDRTALRVLVYPLHVKMDLTPTKMDQCRVCNAPKDFIVRMVSLLHCVHRDSTVHQEQVWIGCHVHMEHTAIKSV